MARRTSRVRPNTFRDLSANYWELNQHPEFRGDMSWEERDELSRFITQDKQKRAQRFDAIANVYQTADSILTNSKVAVRIATFGMLQEGNNNPAWSDGTNIYLNDKVLKDIDDKTIISLNGINYHEVAHLLWTPRAGSEVVKQLSDKKLISAWNILEDQRIETLLVERFPSTKISLTSSSLTYIVSNATEEILPTLFPLITGRKYLPLDIRQLIADKFINKFGASLANKISDIINEYRFLILSSKSDGKRAVELVEQFADLLNLKSDDDNGYNNGNGSENGIDDVNVPHGTCGNRKPMKNGRTESVKSQTKTSESAQANDGEQEQLIEQSGDSSNAKADSNSTNNAGSSGSGGNTKSDNETQADPIDEHLVNRLNEAIDDVMKSAQARQDVRQVRQAIKQSDATHNNVGKTSYKNLSLSGDERANARAFGNELVKLQIDNDPAWHRELPSGKLNIQRTMNMDINNLNTLFDRWDTGNEAFDIEAVILVDNSGSMDGQMPEACRSAWTIKKALEAIDAKVTVYVFDDETKLLYSANEKANVQNCRFVGAGGSTNPMVGLLEAENIFNATRRKTKLLFVVTDGEWFSEDECNKAITRINSIKGTISNLVYITNGYQSNRLDKDELKKSMQRWKHNCHAITLVNRPKDIVNVARDVVRTLSNR